MKLFLIRHGETNKNVDKKLHEMGDIESLNTTGKKQLKKVGEALKDQKINMIFCSKEIRATESANILSDMLESPQMPIDGFEERNWGVYSNKTWSEVKSILDPLAIEERFLYTPPEGESWKTFEKRLIDALKESIDKVKGGNIAIVTHGGAIRALMPYLLGVPREESFKYDPANASITEFEYDGGTFLNIRIDDTSHLHN